MGFTDGREFRSYFGQKMGFIVELCDGMDADTGLFKPSSIRDTTVGWYRTKYVRTLLVLQCGVKADVTEGLEQIE